MTTAKRGTVLAFDFGLRRIGVATGNIALGTSSALTTVPARAGIPDWQQVESLLKEWQAEQLVVGLPLNMDGSDNEITVAARRFARRLQGRYGLPVALADERLSSVNAEEQLREAGVDPIARPEAVDRLAASLILETWLAERSEDD